MNAYHISNPSTETRTARLFATGIASFVKPRALRFLTHTTFLFGLPLLLLAMSLPVARANALEDGFDRGANNDVRAMANMANTKTYISSSRNPSYSGQSVTLTATVSVVPPGVGTPTGSVKFWDGEAALSGCTAQPLSGGKATCTLSTLSIGSHSLIADYYPDNPDYVPSSSPVFFQVVAPVTGACRTEPGAPTLVAPAHRAILDQPRVTLDWDDVPCARWYQVVVHRDNRMGRIVAVNLALRPSQFEVKGLEAGQRYVWRVRACGLHDAKPCGAWSAWREFRINASATGGNKP